MRRPQGNNDRDYVAIQSFGHHTASPIVAVCLERNGALAFGVSSRTARLLSDRDREDILATIRQILEDRANRGPL